MVAPVKTLIDELLEKQRRLDTPVARFSDKHDRGATPALEPQYRDLIPLTAPKAGEQYAFEVDLDACTGCKACVAACHSLNGLDEHETWRDVGLLVGGTTLAPYQQTVTTACHHCADPGCLNGCPVLAYDKDPVTGIVRHLDDQCIGCQYCVLKCPYDVPKYNDRLGIVRKCDMCHQRLGEGEAPACVQACPTQAIRIVTVDVAATAVAGRADEGFLPGAPSPIATQPTTRYVTSRPLPANARAADAELPRVQPAHTPLAVMLVLTQLALGLQFAGSVTGAGKLPSVAVLLGAWALAAAGLVTSVAHLGQPLKAWRIFLGLRRSWLSREAVVFGAWFGAFSAQVGASLLAVYFPSEEWASFIASKLAPTLAPAALALGGIGVACSAMIYVDAPRAAWRAPWTFGRFFGTAVAAAALALHPLAGAAALAAKLLLELAALKAGPAASRAVMRGPLRLAAGLRFLCGGAAIALLALAPSEPGAWAMAVLFFVGGEFAERSLFFRAVDGSKMPGGVAL
ncbi:MAG TPA: DmsC/YnfH family molybdoenzyme membrane anchor subunit [Opitutaceae bacterium]